MDEIFIEEKRYVSSKRAAKVTGYAKDYIGQLCREGRVPARLVGRSWYVLESAIQDHRFGNAAGSKENALAAEISDSVAEITRKWETPRYEAVQAEEIPQVRKTGASDTATGGVAAIEASLKDAWQEWFDHVSSGFSSIEPDQKASEAAESEHFAQEKSMEVTRHAQESGTKVPIRAIYQPALKPPPLREQRKIEKEIEQVMEGLNNASHAEALPAPRYYAVIGGIMVAIFIVVGVIGTGYFDKYIYSYKPATFIAGVAMYKK